MRTFEEYYLSERGVVSPFLRNNTVIRDLQSVSSREEAVSVLREFYRTVYTKLADVKDQFDRLLSKAIKVKGLRHPPLKSSLVSNLLNQ